MSDSEQHTETSRWTTSFRAGLFAWPAMHREIIHACVAAGVNRRVIRARWRGFGVHVDVELQGEAPRLRRLARFIDDLVEQLRA